MMLRRKKIRKRNREEDERSDRDEGEVDEGKDEWAEEEEEGSGRKFGRDTEELGRKEKQKSGKKRK